MPTVGEGPWGSYEESFRGRIAVTLREADENTHIRGWRSNEIREGVMRERIDAFVEQARGLSTRLEELEEKERRCIVHADFSKFSILSLYIPLGACIS
jgi:exonuclease III